MAEPEPKTETEVSGPIKETPLRAKKTAAYVDDLVHAATNLIRTGGEATAANNANINILDNHPTASKIAPDYVQELIDHPELNEEETSLTIDETSPFFDSSNTKSFSALQEFRQKIKDDDRLTNMYKLHHNFSSRFDNRAWLHPHGTTNFDYQSIPKRREIILERFKNRVRKENYVYLGNHPEIQAMISLFLKKLLTVRPIDCVEYLAEFFATRLKDGGINEFEEQLREEEKKLSRYHIFKMKNTGKINIRPSSAYHSEATGEEFLPEFDANFLKKMNIGPLAADFSFDPSCLMSIKKKNEEDEAERKKKIKRKKKKQHKYCGCKDWKLKKNRQGRNTNVGNVYTLMTSEEEEESDEEEEGLGEFMGRLGREEDEDADEELSPNEAERIASELVHEFLNPDMGVYRGHHVSMGSSMKNIQ